MNTFQELKAQALEIYEARVEAAKASLKALDAEENSKPGAFKTFLKAEPVAAVPIGAALNVFLDLSMCGDATTEQRDYCRYLTVSIPGRNFCDATWIVESLNSLDDPPTLGVDYAMPVPSLKQMGQLVDDSMQNQPPFDQDKKKPGAGDEPMPSA